MQDNLPSKKLIALISEERAIPRSGYKIFSKDKKEVGVVTSGGMSPCLLYTSPSPRDVEESRMPSSA